MHSRWTALSTERKGTGFGHPFGPTLGMTDYRRRSGRGGAHRDDGRERARCWPGSLAGDDATSGSTGAGSRGGATPVGRRAGRDDRGRC